VIVVNRIVTMLPVEAHCPPAAGAPLEVTVSLAVDLTTRRLTVAWHNFASLAAVVSFLDSARADLARQLGPVNGP